ncbi:hypothetical protein ACIBQX_45885 [Nonomuraea sp. NPDC049714]|uniref:hypothetical protein n=1 Tax=Nonomuraea sp. NPDC049714 TaxID=3364357 RepID=UPI0037AA5E30
MTAFRRVPPVDPVEPAAPEADPFPGDTHWYDLPDDDAEPEEAAWWWRFRWTARG